MMTGLGVDLNCTEQGPVARCSEQLIIKFQVLLCLGNYYVGRKSLLKIYLARRVSQHVATAQTPSGFPHPFSYSSLYLCRGLHVQTQFSLKTQVLRNVTTPELLIQYVADFRRILVTSYSRSASLDCLKLNIETLESFGTSETIYQTTWRNIPQYLTVYD